MLDDRIDEPSKLDRSLASPSSRVSSWSSNSQVSVLPARSPTAKMRLSAENAILQMLSRYASKLSLTALRGTPRLERVSLTIRSENRGRSMSTSDSMTFAMMMTLSSLTAQSQRLSGENTTIFAPTLVMAEGASILRMRYLHIPCSSRLRNWNNLTPATVATAISDPLADM